MQKEAVTLFDVCLLSLHCFEEQPAPVKGKFDIKLCSEIDEILGLLYRLFSDFPKEKINDIPPSDFNYLVSNMLRYSTADKYRIGGFFLLLKYMNILVKNGIVVSENYELLFEKCLCFEETLEELIPISLKMIPRLEYPPSSERWVTLISKETGDAIKALIPSKEDKGTLNEFFDYFETIIDKHFDTAKYWFNLIKKKWFKYFYPDIYFQYEKDDGESAETTGYHPLCPPMIHRKVCKMFLQFFGSESMLNILCDVKENLYFMLDVLSQTYWTANKKTLCIMEHFDAYEKIRKDFLIALRALVLNDIYFKAGIEQGEELENPKNEISLKIFDCFLKVFQSEFWFLEVKPEEFTIILSIISMILKKIDTVKFSDKTMQIYILLFNSLVNASEKIGLFLDQQKEKKGFFSEDSQQALSYIERLINQIFDICLSPSIKNDQRIWSKMREFSKKWCTNSIFILLWQKSVVEAASNLADRLGTMSDAEYKVLCDDKLLPFEGLPMKKEYSLQVLYNAHTALVSRPPEEAMTFSETSAYKEVYNTALYKRFDLWLNILKLVQFPPGVVKREILIEYIKTLHGVIDAVVPVDKSTKMREGKEHVILSSFPPPNTTIFDLFSLYLFPFCQPPESGTIETEEVRNISLRTVCSLFCGNQCEVPLPLGYFAHIIRIIYLALSSGTNTTKSIVLQYTKCIFSLDYRGLLVLIPTYLDQIEHVLNPSNDFSYKTKNAAMTLLASLLCIPDYYEKFEIKIIGTSEMLKMSEVKSRVIKEVMNSLERPVKDDTNLRYLKKGLCCATVILFQESAKSVPSILLIRSLVEIILTKCMDINVDIQSVALSCISTVGYLFPTLNELNPTLIPFIFDQLANRMNELTIEKGVEKPIKQSYLSNLIQALLELVIEDRYRALVNNKDTFIKIMDSASKLSKMAGLIIKDEALMLIEFVKEYYLNYPLRNQSTTVTGSLFDELEFYSLQENTLKSFHRSFKTEARRNSIPDILEDDKLQRANAKRLAGNSKTQIAPIPVHEELDPGLPEESSSARFYEMLKKASPMVMQYLTGSTDPIEIKKIESPGKSTTTNPRDAEYHAAWKAKTIHFAYGNEAIISIIQSPYLSSRIIIRDLIGKHGWLITEHRVLDYNCIDTIDYNDKAAVYKNLLNLKGDQKLKDLITENKGMPETLKSSEEEDKKELAMKLENEITKATEGPKVEDELKKVEETDALARVLKLFGKHCSDASIFKELLAAWEEQEIEKNAKEIAEFEAKTTKVDESEQALFKVADAEHKKKNEEEFKADVKLLTRMYSSEQTRIDHARAFLCHLGDLEILPSAGIPSAPQLLLLKEDEPDFRMMLESLDNNCGLRRSIKLGVIYVERGQFDQKSILYNTKGSAKYEEFLTKLGKPVSHRDIHKSLMLQPEGLYYATATYELVFHVITLMATNFNDTQQLEKKKYVGNDLVHIVWSENDRLYKPGTITGAFNFVHIIVYPMRNGLYKVLIEKKKDDKKGKLVNFFGPLLNGMVVPMEILPSLLRFTAINARKNITIKQLQMMNVMTERRSTLEKIISMYCRKATTKAESQFLLVDRLMQSSSK